MNDLSHNLQVSPCFRLTTCLATSRLVTSGRQALFCDLFLDTPVCRSFTKLASGKNKQAHSALIGKWRVGAKRAYDLFPGPLRSRIKGERKKRFAEEQRAALTAATKAAAAAKVPSSVFGNHSCTGVGDGCSSAGRYVTAVVALATSIELPQTGSGQLAGHCWRAEVDQRHSRDTLSNHVLSVTYGC